jgi:hypothetical protein
VVRPVLANELLARSNDRFVLEGGSYAEKRAATSQRAPPEPSEILCSAFVCAGEPDDHRAYESAVKFAWNYRDNYFIDISERIDNSEHKESAVRTHRIALVRLPLTPARSAKQPSPRLVFQGC